MKKIFLFSVLSLLLVTPLLASAQGATPKIRMISPSSGPVGTVVTINGENFLPNCLGDPGVHYCKMRVCFGRDESSACVASETNNPNSLLEWSNTQIKAKVPTGAITGPVYLTYHSTSAIGVMPPAYYDYHLMYYKTSGPSFTPYIEKWEISYESDRSDGPSSFQSYQDKLYLAGFYPSAERSQGVVWVFDGSNWYQIYSMWNEIFHSLEVSENKLFLGGGFENVPAPGGKIYVFDGILWEDDYSYQGSIGAVVKLIVYKNQLYAFALNYNEGNDALLIRQGPRNWQIKKELSRANDYKAIVFNDKLFFTPGGSIIYIYDGIQVRESQIPSLGTIMSFSIYQNKLYGVTSEGRVYEYNEENNSWGLKLTLGANHLIHDAIVFNDKMYIGGRKDINLGPAIVYVWDGSNIQESFTSDKDIFFSKFGVHRNNLYVATNNVNGKMRIYMLMRLPISETIVRPEEVIKKIEIVKPEIVAELGLVREKGKAGVYAIDEENKEKMPIVDRSIFEAYNLDWKKVKEVGKEKLEVYEMTKPVGLPENTLVKTPDKPTVYVIKEGELRPIASPSVFKREGYKWKDIKVVPERVIDLHFISEVLK